MAYQKRTSSTLNKALARLRGLESLDLKIDLGNGLSLQNYAAAIAASNAQLQAHNLALAEVDRTRLEFAEAEAGVAELSSRILNAVAAVYGRDSKEYEMAGGKPRKLRRAKKPGTVTSLTSQSNGGSSGTALTNGATMNGTTVGA